jgi:hypothetical protein
MSSRESAVARFCDGPGGEIVMHYSRGYAATQGSSALGATTPTLADRQYYFADILSAKPKRGIGAMLRDICFVAISWTFFIGLIVYPVAHLVGLAACAIALIALPTERR